MLVGDGEIVEVPVGERPVRLRTLAGDVYLLCDDGSELIDSVLLRPDGTWCVTRLTADLVVVGYTGNLHAALQDLPASRAPLNVNEYRREGIGPSCGLLTMAIAAAPYGGGRPGSRPWS